MKAPGCDEPKGMGCQALRMANSPLWRHQGARCEALERSWGARHGLDPQEVPTWLLRSISCRMRMSGSQQRNGATSFSAMWCPCCWGMRKRSRGVGSTSTWTPSSRTSLIPSLP